jgi:hypothetical protein
MYNNGTFTVASGAVVPFSNANPSTVFGGMVFNPVTSSITVPNSADYYISFAVYPMITASTSAVTSVNLDYALTLNSTTALASYSTSLFLASGNTGPFWYEVYGQGIFPLVSGDKIQIVNSNLSNNFAPHNSSASATLFIQQLNTTP